MIDGAVGMEAGDGGSCRVDDGEEAIGVLLRADKREYAGDGVGLRVGRSGRGDGGGSGGGEFRTAEEKVSSAHRRRHV